MGVLVAALAPGWRDDGARDLRPRRGQLRGAVMGSFTIQTMAEIFQTGDEFSCLEYDVEGSIRLGDGAHWKNEHWVWFEDGHLLDARCPVCTSDRKCHQQLMLYPLRGHLVVVHDAEGVVSEGDA